MAGAHRVNTPFSGWWIEEIFAEESGHCHPGDAALKKIESALAGGSWGPGSRPGSSLTSE